MQRVKIVAVVILLIIFKIKLINGDSIEETDDQEITGDNGNKPISYSGFQLITISPENKRQRKAVIRLSGKQGIHFWLAQRTVGGNFFAQVLLSPNATTRTIKRLQDKGIKYRIVVRDLQDVINTEAATSRDSAIQLAREGHPLTWNKYHRYQDMHEFLKYIARTTPDRASVMSIGRSYEGRDLTLLRLGYPSKNKLVVWIDGGVHAREWISPAVVTYIAKGMLDEYDLLKKFDFYFLPVLNPDGYEYSHMKDRLWRKTRSPQIVANSSKICYGVDANRNWDSHWNGRGASPNPCTHNYPGTHPFSEPETRYVSELLKKLKPDAYLTLHSYSQLWLMPWGHSKDAPEDEARLRRVALRALEAIQDVGGSQYLAGSIHNMLYPISGSSLDWVHDKVGSKLSYLVELRDKGDHGFVLPPSEIEATGKEMFAAVKAMALEMIRENITHTH